MTILGFEYPPFLEDIAFSLIFYICVSVAIYKGLVDAKKEIEKDSDEG